MRHLKLYEEYESELFNFSYEPIEVSEELDYGTLKMEALRLSDNKKFEYIFYFDEATHPEGREIKGEIKPKMSDKEAEELEAETIKWYEGADYLMDDLSDWLENQNEEE